MISAILHRIEQWWCVHPASQQVRRAENGVLCVECMVCLKRSAGIETGK